MDPGELSFGYTNRNAAFDTEEDILSHARGRSGGETGHYDVAEQPHYYYYDNHHYYGNPPVHYQYQQYPPEFSTRRKSITQQLFQESYDTTGYDIDNGTNLPVKSESNAFHVKQSQPELTYHHPHQAFNGYYLSDKLNHVTFYAPAEELSLSRQQTNKTRKIKPTDTPTNKSKSETLTKGRRKWTAYEDDLLRKAVKAHDAKNWKNIANMVPGRNHVQCLQRWKKVLKPGLIKGHWSKEEDEQLKKIVKKGYRNWGEVAQQINGRTAKQCRERWCCNLDPNIRRDKWTEEEDAKILAAQREIGNKWSTIAQMLPGRTENAIKTRAKSLQRQAKKKWSKTEDEIIISLKTITAKGLDSNSLEDEDIENSLGLRKSSAWAKIAERLPGRSKNAVKKRWKELRENVIRAEQQQQLLNLGKH